MIINNRELSWLSFNDRVLQEAQDKSVPLLQRLRFLGIFSNNQDEFTKVRVANLIRHTRIEKQKNIKFTGGYTAKELLPLVNSQILKSQITFSETYCEILSEMEKHGIHVVNEKNLDATQISFCLDYFSRVISPRLFPLILRKTLEIPFLKDKNIYHAVKMSSDNKRNTRYAVIQIPVSESCPRFVVLPSSPDRKDIIFIDDIIRLCLDEIFFMFNYDEISAYTFKLMRDAQLTLDDDISKSVIEKMEEGLNNRLHGQAIRLIYDREMPKDLLEMLTSKLKLKNSEYLDAGGRYHLMKDLMDFPRVDPELENINPLPIFHKDIQPFSSILKIIRKKDILLNYPYHTFNHFIDFLREAAIDPKVKNIYITLYRTAERSKVIRALVNAAKNGKNVTAVLELFARFDEEQNIENTEELQKEGVKIIHGSINLKVHSKLVLIEKKEGSTLKKYAYIGTGNFNEATSHIYSDIGLFTSDPRITQEVNSVFDSLQNPHKHVSYKHLMVSPGYMRKQFENLINEEIKNAEKQKKSFIYAKFNSLTDESIIKLLYKASQAGVKIHLIIRGACCLQPQIKSLSENIRVISIVDKYLEHARIAIFCNGGNEKYYILSSDWMTRNLDCRVEVGAPIYDKEIQKNLKDVFDIQWSDNEKARDLKVFGLNNYGNKGDHKKVRAQLALYEYYKQHLKK